MWAKGLGARAPKGTRRSVFEDACENACKDARGAEKKVVARNGDEAPSTLALSKGMQTA